MDADTEDDGLIERFRAGDEAALRLLFERYEPQVRLRIKGRIPLDLKRKFSVDDVLQETWITAFRRFSEFESRGEGAFGAWIGQIAIFKLKEEIRRFRGTARRGASREVSRGARPDTTWFQGANPSPSQHAMGREMELRLQAAITTLPEDYREALHLVQTQRLSLRDAAERMGRSREAMKKHYARAVGRLAAILEVGSG